jgi:hypothetical protein
MFVVLLFLLSAAMTSISAFNTYYEVKPGYFFLLNEQEKQTYHNGGADVGVELGTDIACYVRVGIEGRFFSKSHNQLNLLGNLGYCSKSRLRIASITPWLKFIMPSVHGIRPYFGVGPQVQFVRNYYQSVFEEYAQHACTPGSVYTIGFQCSRNRFFIDPFVQYQTGKAYFAPTIATKAYTLSTRGIKVGCGIGYNF